MEIATARREFEQDSPYWDFRFIHVLERIQNGLCLDWAYRCVARLLAESGSVHRQQLQSDFDRLPIWAQRLPVTPLSRNEMSRTIWSRPGRDAAQTALSHLYASHEAYQRGETGYTHMASFAVNNFLWDSAWAERRDELFEVSAEVFRQIYREHCGEDPA
jgi:hypothetical protein